MPTYRAAYVPPEVGSNGVGVLLKTQEHSTLTDDELIAVARQVAAANDVESAHVSTRQYARIVLRWVASIRLDELPPKLRLPTGRV